MHVDALAQAQAHQQIFVALLFLRKRVVDDQAVALDLDLDEGLRKRGLSRDVVRLLQDLRKSSGLEVSDRIRVHVVGLDVIAESFDFIAREVLAVEIISGPGSGDGVVLELDDELLAEPVRVWIQRIDTD